MKQIVETVLKALTVAMGVAVLVLSVMKSLNVETAISLLGIGLTSAGLVLMTEK